MSNNSNSNNKNNKICANCYRAIHGGELITEKGLNFCSNICHRKYMHDRELWNQVKRQKIKR